MTVKPGISVLMAMNRLDDFHELAIESILNQTLPANEVLVVVNGDNRELIKKTLLEKFDKRIVIIECEIGQLALALNIGLMHTQYQLIARMDSDDISHPNRLKIQSDFITNHHLDMAGSFIKLIDENGRNIGERHYPTGKNILKTLPFTSPFAHPSIMVRRDVIIAARGYNAGFNSEDYDLWRRLGREKISWDNIPDYLLSYRINSNASQRRLLGYAESTALALREFILQKTMRNFLSIPYHLLKSFIRSR